MSSFVSRFAPALALMLAVSVPAAMAQDTDAAATTDDSAAATAPVRMANGQRFGAWTVTCEALAVNETACVLSQTLVQTEGNNFLAEILAFWSGDGSSSYMAARVPNGVYFPSGFAFKPEDSEERQTFVWQSCSRELCEALIEIDAETLKELEAGAPVFAGYRPRLGADPMVFQLNLDGIGEGMDALQAALSN
ncbi:invasion associated locus B family protein [Pseudooceanicola sp. MF1-13]|uniref:invasion associated locus B family protein n=1 Tax=Pseudooceanicola sp. MF1-13 TaxID=3379095 RepID=UPI003891A9E8